MKLVISNLEDVAEGLRSEYEAKDGKFHLKLEGDLNKELPALASANSRIVEFRTNNIALQKELDELRPIKQQFEGIDAAEAKKALEKVKALHKKGVNEPDDVDTRLKTMLDDAMKPVKEQLALAQTREQESARRADEMTFDAQLGEVAKKAGAHDNALRFLAGLAKDTFEIKDGKVVAKTGKFSTDKPGDPLSIAEWVQEQTTQNAFAFAQSNGGGAPGGGKPESGGKTTPTLKAGQTILKNPTPQELGSAAKDIKDGKIKVVYDDDAVGATK